MRDYGKVYTAFWSSEDARGLSEDGRTLALYLMTCPHGNMLGCFRLTNAYAADDLKWEIERVSKGFDELFQKGFAYRCDKTFWVFIRQYLKWNQFENPNVGKAAGKLFESITPPHTVKALLVKALREFSEVFPTQKLNDFETLGIPFENPFELSSKTVVVAVAPTTALAIAPAETRCATASGAAPQKKSETPKAESKTFAIWVSYSTAYLNRYGVDPVRNAKVNGQLSQVVDRIGAEEAPHVASFFVSHQNAYYVKQMHSADLLLKDCEKLRTEWATRTQMTQTRALQVDRTQTNFDAFAPLIAEAEARENHNG